MNALLPFLLLIISSTPTLAQQLEKAHAAPSYPVWPIPRESSISNERLLLTSAAIVVPEGEARLQYPGRLLAELIADQFEVALPVAVGKVLGMLGGDIGTERDVLHRWRIHFVHVHGHHPGFRRQQHGPKSRRRTGIGARLSDQRHARWYYEHQGQKVYW